MVNTMGLSDEAWAFRSGVVWGVIFCIIFIPVFQSFYKIAARKFNMLYQDEKILYIVENRVGLMVTILFIVGAYFGLDIFPFLILDHTPQIETLFNNLAISILMFFGIMYFLFERFGFIYILSDKKITLLRTLHSIKSYKNIKIIEYKDIKSIDYSKVFTFEIIHLALNDCKYFNGLMFFKNLDYVKKLIEENVRKEGIVNGAN